MTKIVAISDTHCQLNEITIPDGDILIHSGDLTYRGTLQETVIELDILKSLKNKFKYIVLISGNHDFLDEKQPGSMKMLCDERGLIYLNHESIIIDGINIFGSPYTPYFFNWAFNIERGDKIANKWAQIPDNTDVLITHGPPMDTLDQIESGEHVGCLDLANKVNQIKPRIHIFGHIHSQSGISYKHRTYYINASICDETYKCTNPARIIMFNRPQSKFLVYGLTDPRTNLIRYIGKSCKGMERPYEHFCGKEMCSKTKKSSWIKSLISKNLFPYIQVLGEYSDEKSVEQAEIEYINKFESNRLVNMKTGGTGGNTGGGQKRRRPIFAKEIATGLIKEYAYIHEAVKDGFEATKVCAVCRGTRLSHKGFKFWYKGEQESTVLPKTMQRIKAINTITSEIIVFPTFKATALHFNKSIYQIYGIVRFHKIINNYSLEPIQ